MKNRWGLLIIVLFIVVIFVYMQKKPTLNSPLAQNTQLTPSPMVGQTQVVLGEKTKSSGCQIQGALQDSACTPGAVFSNVTSQQICTPGYSKSVRNVSTETKKQVYEEYGIASHKPYSYEVDHLISLELGGSNDISNLWPEAADPRPGYHEKDEVENYLHDQVCEGKLSLQEAQKQISTNWLQVYQQLPDPQQYDFNAKSQSSN